MEQYDKAFQYVPQITPQVHPANQNLCYHLYIVRVSDRKALYEYLRKQNIYTQVHYIPIHLQPYYMKHFGTGTGQFPQAEAYYQEALSLPLFPKMSNEDQMDVVEALKAFYE